MSEFPFPSLLMRAELTARPYVEVPGARTPTADDTLQLVRLMRAAYALPADELGECAAVLEIGKTITGKYGVFIPACSRIVVRGDQALHATIVTRLDGRCCVAFTMTAPAVKRTGLARACLVNLMQDLRSAGETELWLAVRLGNSPARNLFENLGFSVQSWRSD